MVLRAVALKTGRFYHVTIKESAVFDAGLALILVYGDSLLVALFKAPAGLVKAARVSSPRLNSHVSSFLHAAILRKQQNILPGIN